MTNPLANSLPIPLTAVNHQIAAAFYQQHSDARKARQVYLNTLSVQAVQFYLSCLDIKTSLEKSQSWNSSLQVLIDTADLWIEGIGALECRSVLANAKACFIPPQVLTERISYVVVRLNTELTEAELLGFVPKVETEQLLLEKLQPIEEFPGYLNQLALATSQVALTRLSDWFHTITETGWKTLEMIMGDWQGELALSFRIPAFSLPEFEASGAGVKRGKLLVLGETPEEQVLLLMEVSPDRTASEYQIRMELSPIGKEVYLPRSLHVSVMDEAGRTVLQAESNGSEGLEFQFSGELGEQFSIRVSLRDYNVMETFEI